MIARQAAARSGRNDLAVEEVTVGLNGDVAGAPSPGDQDLQIPQFR